MKTHYFGCKCKDPSHQLVLTYDDRKEAEKYINKDRHYYDDYVYFNIGLRRPFNFFRRLIIVIKYLLNIETEHYHFEVMLDSDDQQYMIKVLQEKQEANAYYLLAAPAFDTEDWRHSKG